MPSLPRALRRLGGLFASGRSNPVINTYDDGDYTLKPDEALNTSLFAAAIYYMRFQFGEPPLRTFQDGTVAKLRGQQRAAAEFVEHQLNQPNEFMGREAFTKVGVDAMVQGNGYFYLNNVDRFGIPESLWPVSFWRVKLALERGSPQYYIDNQPVPTENIIHIRNGLDEETLLGTGPLYNLLLELFADQRAFKYIAWLMKNRAMPSYALYPKDRNVHLDQQDMEQESDRIALGSTEESSSSIITFSHPLEMKELGFDPKSLNMSDLTKITAERFCAVMRIPPPILYVASNVPADNRSTLGHYRRLAAEDLFKPFWGDFARQFTRQYLRRFLSDETVSLEFDISKVSALQEDDSVVATRTSQAWNDGAIPLNTYLRRINEEEITGGDEIYMQKPFSRTPEEQIQEREEMREEMKDNFNNDDDEDEDAPAEDDEQEEDDDTGTEQESA